MAYCPGADGTVTPEELSSWLLKHLVHRAQMYLKESVTGAVITVPAHFNRVHRQATLNAAAMAGLRPPHVTGVHVLQEPVAAALAYGIDGGTDGDTVLVVDIGGGTLDISILQAFEGIVQVLGTAGDGGVGGDDFDAAIARWIVDTAATTDGGEEVGRWALVAARAAKEELSYQDESVVTTPDGSKIVLTTEIFESLTRSMFERVAAVMEGLGEELFVEWAVPRPQDAISTSNSSTASEQRSEREEEKNRDKWAPPPRRITKVALVGQITRLPSIRRFIQTLTGVEPSTSVDPGAAVALGAAIHAGVLLGSLSSVEVMDGSFVADLHSRTTGFSPDWEP